MKMEEKQNNYIQKPINLTFIPVSLDIPFITKIKLQIAFYRGNKLCKTKPNKYVKNSNDSSDIKLEEEKLPFCTTISYNQTNGFENKKIDVQLAFEADGKRQQLYGNLDLKNFLDLKPSIFKENLQVNFSNNIVLKCSIEATFTSGIPLISQKQITSSEKNNEAKKTRVKIEEKVEEEIYVPQVKNKRMIKKSNSVCLSNSDKVVNENERKKTYQKNNKHRFSNDVDASQEEQQEKINEMEIKDKQIEINHTVFKAKKKQSLNCSVFSETQDKISFCSKNLQKQNQKLTKKVSELSHKLNKKTYEMEELEKSYKKLVKDENGQISKENQAIFEKKNMQIKKLQETISRYINKEESLFKSEREWKQKFREAERKNLIATQKLNELSSENEKLKVQVKNMKQKMKEVQQQFQDQMKVCEGKIKSSDAKSSEEGKYQKELEQLKKQLHNKEKMVNFFKVNKQNSISQAKFVERLEKENGELKEELQNCKKNVEKVQSNELLEIKVNFERIRKENQQCKKAQKILMQQKNSQRNEIIHLQEQLIKLKQAMANVLNIVQQESQQLYTLVTDYV